MMAPIGYSSKPGRVVLWSTLSTPSRVVDSDKAVGAVAVIKTHSLVDLIRGKDQALGFNCVWRLDGIMTCWSCVFRIPTADS